MEEILKKTAFFQKKNILHNKVHIYTKIQKSNYHLY